jgi:hypothetical protein
VFHSTISDEGQGRKVAEDWERVLAGWCGSEQDRRESSAQVGLPERVDVSREWRTTSVFFFLIAVLASCTFQETWEEKQETGQEGPNASPSDLVAAWIEMWNDYDLDRVPELFLADDRVTYFSSEFEGVIQGFPGVLAHHEGFGFVPGGAEKGTRLWVEELTEARFQNSAVLTGIWFFQREESPSESISVAPQRGPVTFVCVLEGGKWRFAHMNFRDYLDVEGEEGGEAR